MRWDDIGSSLCPIARSLSVVGDRWTLLILRELGLGTRRFEEVQAQTGMSSHLLSTRLKRLRAEGVVEWRLYSVKPARYEYSATTKGKELDAVLFALQIWGQKWGGFDPQDEPSLTWLLKGTGEKVDSAWQSPNGDKPFTFDYTEPVISAALGRTRCAANRVSGCPARYKRRAEIGKYGQVGAQPGSSPFQIKRSKVIYYSGRVIGTRRTGEAEGRACGNRSQAIRAPISCAP